MNRNKYILLFEAFSAKTISKTIAFLNKEVGKGEKDKFLNDIKKLTVDYDLPVDKIDDSYLEYLGKNDATMVKSEERVNNPDGIYCLKFWFSIDKGYKGYTYTGNETKQKPQVIRKSDGITIEDLKSVGITTGTIITLEDDVSKLKTGDKIVGIFSDDSSRPFQLATAFVHAGQGYYSIQDLAHGSTPDVSDSQVWRRYGRSSWNIGSSGGRRANDNRKLAKYIDDGSVLNINGFEIGKPTVTTTTIVDIMEFNLPMRGKIPRSWWTDSYNSISNEESFRTSDFAIILYYDKLYSNISKRPSVIRRERDIEKEGAYALLKNEDIKRANINRYMDSVCDGLGLNYENDLSPKNLQRLVLKVLNGDLSLMYIGYRDANARLQRLINDISYLLDEYANCEKPLSGRQKERVQERYRNLTARIKDYYSDNTLSLDKERSKELLKMLNDDNRVEELKIFQKILSIGRYISTSSLSNPISTIEDLRFIDIKLNTIRNIMGNDYLRLTSYVRNTLDSLRSDSGDAFYYIKKIKDNEGYEKANARLDSLEKYIKSIL